MLKQEQHRDHSPPPRSPQQQHHHQQHQHQQEPTADAAAAVGDDDADVSCCRGIVQRGKRKGDICGNMVGSGSRLFGFCRHHDGMRQRGNTQPRQTAGEGITRSGAAAGGGGGDTNNMANNGSGQGSGGGAGAEVQQTSGAAGVAKMGKLRAKSRENGFKSWDVKGEPAAEPPQPQASQYVDSEKDASGQQFVYYIPA